jgi:hypothetical protein
MNAKEELTNLLMESYDQGVKDGLETSLQLVKERLAQPEQEPVACRFCRDERGCWAWQCNNCGEIDDSQEPAPPQRTEQEPPQRKPLSFNEITAIEEKVYMRTTHKGKPAFEYANALIRATEAAHGIKENT